MSISAATKKDIPALVTLINSAYRGEASKKGWTTEANLVSGELRTDAAALAEIMENPEATILKYTSDGMITGSVYLENQAAGLYLGMLTVSPTQQANGIGKKLMAAAEEHAKQHNCPRIFMNVISLRQELIEWYERIGYRQTAERKPFPSDTKFGAATLPLEFIIMEKIMV